MLPASDRDRRLAARALSGSLSARCAASSTFGPPGWQIQRPDVVDGQAVLAEEGGDAAVQPALDHLGELRGEHDAEAVRAEPPAQRVRAVRVDLAPGGDHPGAGERRPGAGAAGAPAAARPPPRRRRRARSRRGPRWSPSSAARSASTARRPAAPRRVAGQAEQVVVQPREPRGARHAAEPEHAAAA